jgi:agmatine deiminase
MIPDCHTNFLYLADTLPVKQPVFFNQFSETLDLCGIPYKLLRGTRDIWAEDYMPVQTERNKFVQFVYNPDYLRYNKKESKTISDSDALCKSIGVMPIFSDILLDGGNVIKSAHSVIITDKVFRENPHYSKKDLICELGRIFETEKLIFIPADPNDFTGHADGMVRFLDEHTVLINDYSKEDKDLEQRLVSALNTAGLQYVQIPYNPYSNLNKDHANGTYLNYLEMEQALIIPVFKMKEDELVIRKYEEIFPAKTIATIDSNELAYEGGVLNCISWNIAR